VNKLVLQVALLSSAIAPSVAARVHNKGEESIELCYS